MSKNNNKYSALVFDLGNVLVKIDYNKFLQNTGLVGKYEEMEIYNLLAEPTILYEKGKINSKEFFIKAKEIIPLNIEYDEFYGAWCSVASEMINGIYDVVVNLSKKFPLYLLSNTNEAHMNYISYHFPILNLFKEKFLSYKIGSMKPEKEIFLYMLEKLNIQPNEIFYVDDKLENILTAKELGIISYHFKNSIELKNLLIETKVMEQ